MYRRLLLFGFGALISMFFLSLGPENRLKNTFYAYLDYFDIDKRVITHLINDSTSFIGPYMDNSPSIFVSGMFFSDKVTLEAN